MTEIIMYRRKPMRKAEAIEMATYVLVIVAVALFLLGYSADFRVWTPR